MAKNLRLSRSDFSVSQNVLKTDLKEPRMCDIIYINLALIRLKSDNLYSSAQVASPQTEINKKFDK